MAILKKKLLDIDYQRTAQPTYEVPLSGCYLITLYAAAGWQPFAYLHKMETGVGTLIAGEKAESVFAYATFEVHWEGRIVIPIIDSGDTTDQDIFAQIVPLKRKYRGDHLRLVNTGALDGFHIANMTLDESFFLT